MLKVAALVLAALYQISEPDVTIWEGCRSLGFVGGYIGPKYSSNIPGIISSAVKI